MQPITWKEFGAAIKARRNECGITADELAERIGFTRQYVTKTEIGRMKLNYERVDRFVFALDAPELRELYSRTPHEILRRKEIERLENKKRNPKATFKVGEKIKLLRLLRNMSLRELRDAVGIKGGSVLGKIEKGEIALSDLNRERLERFFKVSLETEEKRRLNKREKRDLRQLKKKAKDGELTIGERIRMLRLEKGMMQKEMAKKAGLAPKYMVHIERGLHKPSRYSLSLLGEVLGEDLMPYWERTLKWRKKLAVSEKIDGDTIGERIKKFRLATGYSQPEFAELIGCADKTIYCWESGRQVPIKHYRFDLFRLGVDIGDEFGDPLEEWAQQIREEEEDDRESEAAEAA